NPEYSYEYITSKNAYKVYSNNIQICYVQLDEEETCVYKDFFISEKRKIRRETYDCYGNLKMVTYLNALNKKPIRKVYYTDSQRIYLCIDYDRETFKVRQCIAYDKNENIHKFFSSEIDMAEYWLATLKSEYTNSVFFVEDRALDKAIIDNKYSSDKFKSIAIIHSSHLKAPYDFGAEINKFNGELLSDTSCYSAVVLLTEQQLKHVRNQFGLQPNLYHIPHIKLEVEKNYHKEKDIYKIVVLSRFVALKRILDILKAFKIAVGKVPGIRLEIWGAGEEEQKYKEFIEENCLQDAVSIKGYTTSPQDVFHSAGLSIITSKYEGFGMTILESMTNQTPMISYDFNYGPRELIDDGINGYIVEDGNIDELAKQIVTAYNSEESLKAMGIAAREKARRFDGKIIKQKWIELVKDVENGSQIDLNRTEKQALLFSEITEIFTVEKEDSVRLSFTLQNTLSPGLPNTKYYLYFSNYYDLEKIGDRYFELNVTERAKESYEVLKGSATISQTVYNELKEIGPKFLLGVDNESNFYFVEVVCSQLL
ncbi:MAG: glycosyltransferase, partial [Tetragenococcus halophilus]|nr:glycosyltransferase [Tetragenococcus halophilus]